MNNFVLEIWDDEGEKCTFYTVSWLHDDEQATSETDKFFGKYNQIPDYKEDVQTLLQLILEQIGDRHGALEAFFNRHEHKATALPPKKT